MLPRSGLAARHGITLVNAPGLIDAGYRGEVRVLLLNTDRRAAFEIAPGDRIAQLLVTPFSAARPTEVVELSATARARRWLRLDRQVTGDQRAVRGARPGPHDTR